MELLSALRSVDFPKKLGICDRLFRRSLERRGIAVIETGAGISWKLDLRNPTHRWLVYGYYDPPFLKWAKKFLPPDGVVVDAGANIGQTAIYLAQYVNRGRLFAFEPGREQAQWLEDGVKKNVKELNSVKVFRLALGEQEDNLFLEDTWKSERFHGGSSQISAVRGEPVKVVRLKDILRDQNITYVDLWKLDVEGYEIPALRGAEEFLVEKRIKALYVELYRQEGDEYKQNGLRIREYLSKFGYRCYLFNRWTGRVLREKKLTDSVNGLFLTE